jgi:2-keto-4-pentenoate hydratase/2-oxohepta-3-ene-1,7-dioic acid hydratase in catechol pathway
VKFVTYLDGKVQSVGILDVTSSLIEPLRAAGSGDDQSLLGVIAAGERVGQMRSGRRLPLAEVKVLAPMVRPMRNIFCVGKNYHEHAREFASSGFDSSAAAGAVPAVPIVFSKVPESVIATGEPILIDANVSTAIDYEVELAVMIGREGRGIKKADALSYVWGYTIINDVTARDLQGRHSQWLIGKSQDTFCPMGPCAVTADEIDLGDTRVRTWVNGELRQDANTRDLIFDVPTLIETISAGITLKPGDIIATGTPAGVGIGFKPPKYLRVGDVVRMEISGIGVIENRIEKCPG